MWCWLNDNFLLNLARNRAHIGNYSCKIHHFNHRMWFQLPLSNCGMQACKTVCVLYAEFRWPESRWCVPLNGKSLQFCQFLNSSKKKKKSRVFKFVQQETHGCACVLMLNDSPGFVPPRLGSRFASGRNNQALSLRTHAPWLALSKQVPTTGLQAGRVQNLRFGDVPKWLSVFFAMLRCCTT